MKPLSPERYQDFILGGNSTFTIRNTETGNRFTYHVTIPHDEKPESARVWFVALLTGSDNEHDYRYIGFVRNGIFQHGNKSKISADAPGVVAFQYVFNKVVTTGARSPRLEIWHEGKCCRCGRKLTVPESIESGIGPECAKNSVKTRENSW